jgi:hypothetical protein
MRPSYTLTAGSSARTILLGRGRGRLTTPDDRRKALGILDDVIANGVRARELALRLFAGPTTLQRRLCQTLNDGYCRTGIGEAPARPLIASAALNLIGYCSSATSVNLRP